MNKIAIMLDDLGPSQLAHTVICQGNDLCANHQGYDVVALYEDLQRPCIPMNFACMQIAEGWAFDGVVVATSFSTAEKLLSFPSASKKLFMVWDLEWIRLKQKSFRQLLSVYGNEQLTLLARSYDHAKAIADCWNRTVKVIEDFNLKSIIEAAN